MAEQHGMPFLRETLEFLVLAGILIPLLQRFKVNQVLGFLVLENGIYTFGAGASGEPSLLVEVGVLLDVFVAVFVMGITIFHFAADTIETGWSSFDELGMLRQLGMLPALVQTSA